MPDINWYPGHMAKSKRLLTDQLRAVDAVIELCDARAPGATRNADLNRLTEGKTRILVFNKADLADDNETAKWLKYYRAQEIASLRFNANGGNAKEILQKIDEATRPARERAKARGINRTARLMVIGIPNVGKSTFINRINGSSIAKAADRPGVTRSNQWVRIGPYLELLDTPGLLPPKLNSQSDARLLAYLGSVRDQILDSEALAGQLLELLLRVKPEAAKARFKLDQDAYEHPELALEAACRGRGWILSAGRADIARGALVILDEFRAGKIGKITLQTAP